MSERATYVCYGGDHAFVSERWSPNVGDEPMCLVCGNPQDDVFHQPSAGMA